MSRIYLLAESGLYGKGRYGIREEQEQADTTASSSSNHVPQPVIGQAQAPRFLRHNARTYSNPVRAKQKGFARLPLTPDGSGI